MPAPDTHTTPTTTADRLPWPRLLAYCALLTLAGTVLLQVAGRFVGFPSLVVVDLMTLAGLLLLVSGGRRRIRSGAAIIGVISLLNNIHAGLFLAAVTAPASDPVTFVTCLATWIGSLLAIPLAVVTFRSPEGTGPSVLVRAVGLVLVMATVVAAVMFVTARDEPARPGDLQVTRERDGWGLFTDNAGRSFAPAQVTATPGPVTIAATNSDPLIGMIFLIPELGVQEKIAPGTTARVTFDAPAGRYTMLDDKFLVEGTLEIG